MICDCEQSYLDIYRVVQLDFTLEIEVFYMLYKRSLSSFSLTSLKQHMEYFNFRCKILGSDPEGKKSD